MKWRVYLCSVLFVFSSLVVGSVIINAKNNVSAVSDVSYTIDPSSLSDNYVIVSSSDCQSLPCSSYHYVKVDISSSDYCAFGLILSTIPSSTSFSFNSFFPLNIVSYDSGLGISFRSIYCPSSSSPSVTITLMESYSSLPSGSITLSQNGTYDVTNYSEAVVDVPAEVIQGDYHDDLVSINNSILICASVCLILYFFYCIYRMLLKGRI